MKAPHFFGELARRINSALRKADFQLNRTYGGRIQNLLRIEGYPPLTELLLYPMAYFLVFGPTFRFRGSLAIGLVAATWLIIFVGGRAFNRRTGFQWFETIVLIILALVTAWFAQGHPREAESHLYQHVLLVVIPLMMAGIAFVPSVLAAFLLRGYKNRWADVMAQLPRVELFVIPLTPLITWREVLFSVIATPANQLSLVLFPVACVVLAVPHDYMLITGSICLTISLVVMGLAGINSRLNAMISLLRRSLFAGAASIVSWTIIALAVARLFDWSYVSTVLNSAGILVVLSFAMVSYSLVWLYDAWTGYVLCRHLLGLLTVTPGMPTSKIQYNILPAAIQTAVEGDQRVVQVQGGRFAAVGLYESEHGAAEAFESYAPAELFEAIVVRAHPGRARDELYEAYGLTGLRNRVRCYTALLNCLLFASFGIAGICLHRLDQVPTVRAAVASADKPTLIADRISSLGGNGSAKNRVLLISASGGGTRAALFAASVFHGLNEVQALDDVVLVSGVSGGSLAAAYLAARRRELIDPQHPEAWTEYCDAMAMPYIDDVIRSCGEMRVVTTMRLGNVLAESFNRGFGAASTTCPMTLGDASIGVIFNSTLAGRRTRIERTWGDTTKEGVGGRLIFSNVGRAATYPGKGFSGVEKERLEYVQILDPDVCVMSAAAVSANFPPVFSNALVSCEDAEYWVTDGGASENRGTVSLLYALRDAIDEIVAAGRPSLVNAPEIHIVIIEASAIDLNYAQDRGFGATFGASERYASQLMQELLEEIKDRYAMVGGRANQIHAHLLPMPMLFRGRGGLGTHWMLPAFAKLKRPEDLPVGGEASVRLNRENLKDLIFDLHESKPAPTRKSSDVNLKTAWEWIDQELHKELWASLVRALAERP